MLYPNFPCRLASLLLPLLMGVSLMLAADCTLANTHPVKTVVVERQQSYQVQRLFAGRVVGSQRADIGFEFAGRVVRLQVENGQPVVRGEVLAELDTEALQIEREELRAARVEVQARLQQIKRDLERFTALSEKGYVSAGQMDDINSRQRATSAQLNQVEEKLRGVKLRLQKSRLLAPFDGEIASLKIEEGVVVGPGKAVMQLVETGSNEAVFGVSDQLGRDLVLGQEMQIRRGSQLWAVKLLSVSRNLDWRTQTRSIRVKLVDQTPLVDGETVHLILPVVRKKAGFWLPMSALLGDVRGTWAVYQVSADDSGIYHLRKRSVQPLYQYRGRVYVQAELQDGDRIVEAGTHRLAPGQRVTLWQDEESLNAE